MPNNTGSASDEIFRYLGRVWNQVVWSVIFVIVIAWDVSVVLTGTVVTTLYAFELGGLTGFTVSGLAFTMTRERRVNR